MKFKVSVSNSVVTLNLPTSYERIPSGNRLTFLKAYAKYWFLKPETTFGFFMKSVGITFFALLVIVGEIFALGKMLFDLLVLIPLTIVLPAVFGYRPVYLSDIEQEESESEQALSEELIEEYKKSAGRKEELLKRLEEKRKAQREDDTDQ